MQTFKDGFSHVILCGWFHVRFWGFWDFCLQSIAMSLDACAELKQVHIAIFTCLWLNMYSQLPSFWPILIFFCLFLFLYNFRCLTCRVELVAFQKLAHLFRCNHWLLVRALVPAFDWLHRTQMTNINLLWIDFRTPWWGYVRSPRLNNRCSKIWQVPWTNCCKIKCFSNRWFANNRRQFLKRVCCLFFRCKLWIWWIHLPLWVYQLWNAAHKWLVRLLALHLKNDYAVLCFCYLRHHHHHRRSPFQL